MRLTESASSYNRAANFLKTTIEQLSVHELQRIIHVTVTVANPAPKMTMEHINMNGVCH